MAGKGGKEEGSVGTGSKVTLVSGANEREEKLRA